MASDAIRVIVERPALAGLFSRDRESRKNPAEAGCHTAAISKAAENRNHADSARCLLVVSAAYMTLLIAAQAAGMPRAMRLICVFDTAAYRLATRRTRVRSRSGSGASRVRTRTPA